MEAKTEAKEVKSEKITLCDLIRGFMEFAVDKGKSSFPPFSSLLYSEARPWHMFLYALKKEHMRIFPDLECIGRFDWDGPYPTVSSWNNVMAAMAYIRKYQMHLTNRVYLCLEARRRVNPLAATHPELLETMFKVACETEGFFED